MPNPVFNPLTVPQRLLFVFRWAMGWLLGKGPIFFARVVCGIDTRRRARSPGRREMVRQAFARAFPERTTEERERLVNLHFELEAEGDWLAWSLPHWSPRRIARRFLCPEETQERLARSAGGPPQLLFLHHGPLTEAVAVLPQLVQGEFPLLLLERPVSTLAHQPPKGAHPGLTRLPRREGLATAKQHLSAGTSSVALHFDENAGSLGPVMLLLDRTCLTGTLPASLAARADAPPHLLHPRRTGFWEGVFEAVPLPAGAPPAVLMDTAHAHLEHLLRTDDTACAGWNWQTPRWRGTLQPPLLLGLLRRTHFLREQQHRRNLPTLPRQHRFVLRLDPRPALLPLGRGLLRILRSQRPDVEVWVLAPDALGLTELTGADRLLTLPAASAARKPLFAQLRTDGIDAFFCLDPSHDAAREARSVPAVCRVGVVHPPGLRSVYQIEAQATDADYLKHPWSIWKPLFPQLGLPAALAETVAALAPRPAVKPSPPAPPTS